MKFLPNFVGNLYGEIGADHGKGNPTSFLSPFQIQAATGSALKLGNQLFGDFFHTWFSI
jgi:hypothetical protein